MDYFSLRIVVEVLRREFGKNTEVALGNVFGVLLPSKGEPEHKPSPSFPAQAQPPAPRDVPSCPGNALPGHPASTSLRWPVLWPASLAPLAQHALWGATASRWGRGESRRDRYRRARPPRHLVFGGAQLLVDAAAVNSECRPDTCVKNPRRGGISGHTKGSSGPVFQLHHRKFARGKGAEA